MHDLFVEVYGTDYLDSNFEFVGLPAVIQGRNTGHIGLGIVMLDLESSGEHWGTFFLTPMGVIDQGGEKMKPAHPNTCRPCTSLMTTGIPPLLSVTIMWILTMCRRR